MQQQPAVRPRLNHNTCFVLVQNWKPSGRVLALSAGGPGLIPRQGPCHTKDVIKIVPVFLLLSTDHYKGDTGSFLKINK